MDNKFIQVASQASIAVIVAGLPAFNRFEFFNPTDDGLADAARHGLEVVGIVSLDREGHPRSAFVVDLADAQVNLLSDMFLELVERAAAQVMSMQRAN